MEVGHAVRTVSDSLAVDDRAFSFQLSSGLRKAPRPSHRHGCRADRLDDRVRRRRKEAVDEVRAGDRLGLGAAIALELGPDAGKGAERSIISQREPHDVFLLRLRGRLGRVLPRDRKDWYD